MAATTDTPVAAPSLGQVQDDVAPMKGYIESGLSTNDTQPTVIGRAEAGTVVSIYDNGVKLGSVALEDTETLWIYTPEAALAAGQHHLTFGAARPDGTGETMSDASFELVIGEDRIASVEPPLLGMVSDDVGPHMAAYLPYGGGTNDTQPTLSGWTGNGNLVTVLDNGVVIGTTLAEPGGNWSFTPEQPLAAGKHTFTMVSSYPDGSDPEAGLQDWMIRVGRDPVGYPYLTGVIDDVGSEQGTLVSWGLPTDDATPTLNGTGEVGTMVTVQSDGVTLGTTLVDANGAWSFTPSEPLTTGRHDLTWAASMSDESGWFSSNGAWTLIVDPASTGTSVLKASDLPPLITGIFDDVGGNMGEIKNGYGVTDDTLPTLVGTALPGTRLELLDGTDKIGEFTSPANDWVWSFTPTTALAAGDHALTVRTIPTDGSAPVTSPYTWTLTEGTTGHDMPPPVITDVLYGRAGPNVFGRVPDEGAVATDQSLMVKGTAVPGTWVNVYDNGTLLGTVTTGPDWTWAYGLSGTDGHHELSAVSRWSTDDRTGTASPYKYTFEVNTGQESVRAPVILRLTDNVGGVQGQINNFDVTDDTTPTLAGTAQPGLVLEVFDVNTKIGEAVVGDDWQWSFTPSTPLNTGVHDFTVRSVTADGEASAVTSNWNFFFVDPAIAPTVASLDTLLANAGLPAADTTVMSDPVNSPAAAPSVQAAVFLSATAVQHDLAY